MNTHVDIEFAFNGRHLAQIYTLPHHHLSNTISHCLKLSVRLKRR